MGLDEEEDEGEDEGEEEEEEECRCKRSQHKLANETFFFFLFLCYFLFFGRPSIITIHQVHHPSNERPGGAPQFSFQD